MENDLEYDDDEDYRICSVCDIRYIQDYGKYCELCEIWICNNCGPNHQDGHLNSEKYPI